jgi:hypothetical protein
MGRIARERKIVFAIIIIGFLIVFNSCNRGICPSYVNKEIKSSQIHV